MSDGDKGLEVIVGDERWRGALDGAEAFARRVVAAAGSIEARAVGAMALLLGSDAALADLNRRFRGKSEPTNVLSFPADRPGFLGDIAIAFETCRREAAESGVAFADHAAHLMIHGVLHLIGYVHDAEDEAAAMESMEGRILATLGVADPHRRQAEDC